MTTTVTTALIVATHHIARLPLGGSGSLLTPGQHAAFGSEFPGQVA
jgi:hypothetical protein